MLFRSIYTLLLLPAGPCQSVCVEVKRQTDLVPAFHLVLCWRDSDLPGTPTASNSLLTVRTLADTRSPLVLLFGCWIFELGSSGLQSKCSTHGAIFLAPFCHPKDQMSRTLKRATGELWVDKNVIITCNYMEHLYSFDILEVSFNNYIFNYNQLILEINI